jgi:hypothetical protein
VCVCVCVCVSCKGWGGGVEREYKGGLEEERNPLACEVNHTKKPCECAKTTQ